MEYLIKSNPKAGPNSNRLFKVFGSPKFNCRSLLLGQRTRITNPMIETAVIIEADSIILLFFFLKMKKDNKKAHKENWITAPTSLKPDENKVIKAKTYKRCLFLVNKYSRKKYPIHILKIIG